METAMGFWQGLGAGRWTIRHMLRTTQQPSELGTVSNGHDSSRLQRVLSPVGLSEACTHGAPSRPSPLSSLLLHRRALCFQSGLYFSYICLCLCLSVSVSFSAMHPTLQSPVLSPCVPQSWSQDPVFFSWLFCSDPPSSTDFPTACAPLSLSLRPVPPHVCPMCSGHLLSFSPTPHLLSISLVHLSGSGSGSDSVPLSVPTHPKRPI